MADKLRSFAEASREPNQIGVLLWREGSYASLLSGWRCEWEEGQLQGLGGQKRGRPRTAPTAVVAQWQQENLQRKAQVAQAELIFGPQKEIQGGMQR